MIETHALHDERQGGRQARQLVGHESEADRLGAFLAAARSHRGTSLAQRRLRPKGVGDAKAAHLVPLQRAFALNLGIEVDAARKGG